MISTFPRVEPPRPQSQKRGHSPAVMSESGRDPTIFFNAEGPPNCDENLMAHWWDYTGLDDLGEVIAALLVQSMEMSKARLRMELAIGSLSPNDRAEADTDRERAMHLCICAMADFQFRKTKLVAKCAGIYVLFLTAEERLRNIEQVISVQQSIADRISSVRNEAFEHSQPSFSPASPIAELHAFRERFRSEANDALLQLSHELSEPAHVTRARVESHALPAAMASMPLLGTPEDLLLRRADVVSLYHRLQSELANSDCRILDSGLSGIDYEQGALVARNEVDRAVNRLRASLNMLTPMRASAASAEAYARHAQQEMRKGKFPLEGLSDAHNLRFARNDQEIAARGETHLALCGLFEALGAGWECVDFLKAGIDSGDSE